MESLNWFRNLVSGSSAAEELDSVKKTKRITTQRRIGRSLVGQLKNDGNTTKLIFKDLPFSLGLLAKWRCQRSANPFFIQSLVRRAGSFLASPALATCCAAGFRSGQCLLRVKARSGQLRQSRRLKLSKRTSRSAAPLRFRATRRHSRWLGVSVLASSERVFVVV
jgi:hypothetical protein